MAKLIATEFTPQEKLPTLKFTLNPVPDDIKVSPKRTKLEPLKDIEIPSAPPSVSTIEAKKVVVGPVTARDAKTFFNPAVFKINPTTLIRVDGNPDPYLRLPPAMPSRATRSGHCDVRLNVDATGSPYKVEALYCTQSLFERPTVKAVEKWKYRPRIVGGRPVPMEGVTNRVSFHLIDERGSLIPESL
jgi:protein TonB